MHSGLILAIEDEHDILALLQHHLEREGFRVLTATDGESGARTAQFEKPDLIILDLMLPKLDGLEVCRRLKHDPHTARTPILILSAKGEESDIVAGLELGAEDYMTKPFSVKVLVARVRRLLRRTETRTDAQAVLRIRDLVIDPGRHEVLLKGKPVDLTFTEFRLLHRLASRPGWVFTRDQIVNAVRGEDYAVTDRAVDVQIVGLRRKLGPRSDYVETVRGVGYRFRE